MRKLSLKEILKTGSDISKLSGNIEDTDGLKILIDEAIKAQKAILKLKEIDYSQLEQRMTI